MNRVTQKKDDRKPHIVACDTGGQSLASTAAEVKAQLARLDIELDDENIWGAEEIQVWKCLDLRLLASECNNMKSLFWYFVTRVLGMIGVNEMVQCS